LSTELIPLPADGKSSLSGQTLLGPSTSWKDFLIKPNLGSCTANLSTSSCGAKIIIRRQYLDILDGQLRTSEVAAEFSGHTVDDQSALLRTRFALANLMLHELAHAFWTSLMSSYDPLGPPGQKFDNPVEPYYCDDRLNELGYAFEQNVISGVTGGIGLNHCVSPYGSSIVR